MIFDIHACILTYLGQCCGRRFSNRSATATSHNTCPYHPIEAILVAERELLCKVPIQDIGLLLLSTFYVFDMQYTPGLINFYTFIETILLAKKYQDKTRISTYGELVCTLKTGICITFMYSVSHVSLSFYQ